MNAELRKKGLGRGLDALFGDSDQEKPGAVQVAAAITGEAPAGIRTISVTRLKPGPYQPRQKFDPEPIEALAASIAAHGVLQPLLVRPAPDEKESYEIIAGERRWRAAQKAQLHEVPIVIQNLSDTAALEIGLIENIQREDLTPIEEAQAYRRLIDEFGHTQEKLGLIVGKSRSHITNMLRLLSLPESITQKLQNGTLSMGHARALLTAEDPMAVARKIVLDNLSVRQVEDMVRNERAGLDKIKNEIQKKNSGPRARSTVDAQMLGKDPDTVALENEMTSLLGLKVDIASRGQTGTFTIHYQSLDQLDDLLRRLTQAVRAEQL